LRERTKEHHEQERFDQLYAQHLQALKLQGKRSKTIDGYARAVRRIAGFFSRCPDNLPTSDLKSDFAWMVENYSWSSVKVDLWGLSFFCRYVLGQTMQWVEIIKPPNSRSLPDIPTRQEVQLLINSVYRLRYRVYVFALYSMGLRFIRPLVPALFLPAQLWCRCAPFQRGAPCPAAGGGGAAPAVRTPDRRSGAGRSGRFHRPPPGPQDPPPGRATAVAPG
jgi:integrase